ncbi:TPA: hypothetical protein QDC20_001787 [Burkholderia aenigmatica]|uniref:hypothetical protein n=1 Tax=Burkholderia sp. AU45251 TaxID=3059204 RepID=UPI0026502B15|nr:hypothetical protein [Burkholderia sp. AU45251]HDR9486960.1 hypothetical protein [Burkholderia aenigmatica]MDN7520828.1 hypothetical protein [Burkholderia sp. AU45251]HDR9518843.1 hypothetical protein [Burkholderia aenigmatica]HDR9595710.1 hypothetical protein [Burkholderia aenigmatica]HDR9602671.1 hypothetical protein [Burkholderia aenigmatica]
MPLRGRLRGRAVDRPQDRVEFALDGAAAGRDQRLGRTSTVPVDDERPWIDSIATKSRTA